MHVHVGTCVGMGTCMYMHVHVYIIMNVLVLVINVGTTHCLIDPLDLAAVGTKGGQLAK